MSEAAIIDFKGAALTLREEVAAEVARLKAEHGLTPGLAVVLVGADPASQIYVRSKGEQSREAGMHSVTHILPADTPQADVIALVRVLNADPAIHGVLVQMPLPKSINEQAVIAAIDPAKDVDGLTMINAGRLASGSPGLTPCTPLGILLVLRAMLGSLSGLNAVVVGRSMLVGRPMAQLHGDHRPLQDPRPARCLPRRRYPGGRGRSAADDQGRLDQAGRQRHRRWH
jgi:methylenetetrahydrofolate dehydrogenase (NADP+)/methenyltetrahydrofolate cyclohydrolase